MVGLVLNSWKEIASYVGRGVRTVQRWEQDLAFPVRRPRGSNRSPVIALKADIDAWMKSRPMARGNGHISSLRCSASLVYSQSQTLHALTLSIQDNIRRAMQLCEAIETRRNGRNGHHASFPASEVTKSRS